MKCPNCGKEILSGHLYCEKCGMEIRIVPDFEPEIENSITETLSTVAEAIEEKQEKEEQEKAPVRKAFDKILEESDKGFMKLKILSFLAVLAAAICTVALIYMNYSTPYQIKNARKYGAQGRFEEALRILDKAAEKNETNAEVAFLRAGYAYQLGKKEEAAKVLLSLIEAGSFAEEEEEAAAYENIIYIYNEQERYEEINELLLRCENETIATAYQYYMALNPEYSYESGSYDEVLYLRLSANTTGTIYFTLDGTAPTDKSLVYTAPILLESGKYQINAIFINDYGIQSEVVRNLYEITLAVPEAPTVTPESGKYTAPVNIEVALPENGEIYYTADGSTPDIGSSVYTSPLNMPLGQSNFKFLIISEEGVSSEVTSRSYEFNLETDITVNMAISSVINALMKRNVLLDTQGHAFGTTGRYIFKYNSVVQIEESYYYVLNEFFVDVNGNESKEARLYAVNSSTGAPNRLLYNELAQMELLPLN